LNHHEKENTRGNETLSLKLFRTRKLKTSDCLTHELQRFNMRLVFHRENTTSSQNRKLIMKEFRSSTENGIL